MTRFSSLFRILAIAGLGGSALGCSAGDVDGKNGSTGGAPSGGGVSCVPGKPCDASRGEVVRETCEASKVGPPLLRRLTRDETTATILAIFPEIKGTWSGALLSPDPMSGLGFSNDATNLVVNGTTAKELLKTAEGVATLVTAQETLGTSLPCSVSAADAECANSFIETIGKRIFRRPLTPAEVERYAAHHASVAKDSDFRTGLKWTLVALIQSPEAFYRREIGTSDGETYTLTPYEIATELAYTYSGAPPDEMLLAAAESGALSTPEEREIQAERLLKDPAHFEVFNSFGREWLGYTKVRGQSRAALPTFPDTAEQLIMETQLFLNQLVFKDNGNVDDLLTANYTITNDALTDFYGFGTKTGDWSQTQRPSGQGVGLLAQGSLMAATAHQTETSPTLRGLLFYTRFLCNSRPKPPDVVPPIQDVNDAGAKTTREKYEKFHAQGSCATCHRHFEPFGYTLEHFDETGRFREMQGSEPLDTKATVLLPDESSVELDGQQALAGLAVADDTIDNCVSGLLTAYLFAGAGGQNCLAEDERRALAEGKLGLRDFMVKLSGTPQFTTRRAAAQ